MSEVRSLRDISNLYVTVVTRCSTKVLLNDEGQSSESDFETDVGGSVTDVFRSESH